MKRWSRRWAAGVGLAVAAGVFAQAPLANVFLGVQRKTTGKVTSTRSAGYSYSDKEYARTLEMVATVKNMGRDPVRVSVEWYFLAKTLNGGTRWIYDKGDCLLDLPGMIGTNLNLVSRELQSTVYATTYYKQETGSKVEGYLVRALQAGKVLRVAGTSRPIEALGRNEADLADLIETSERIQAREKAKEGGGAAGSSPL